MNNNVCTVDPSDIKVTITVQFPKMFWPRMWLAKAMLLLFAFVFPFGTEVDIIAGDDEG